MSARLLDVTPAQYHSDPCEAPSLSASIAHVMVSQSPLHAWYQHPKLGGGTHEHTHETQVGSIIHRMLLGRGADLAVAPTQWHDAKGRALPAVDWRTNEAKEWREAQLADGLQPMLQHEYAALSKTATTLKDRIFAEYGFITDAIEVQREQACEWDQDDVRCRCLWDYANLRTGTLVDIKTIHSAHPKTCGKHASQFGYDIQWAAYTSALAAYMPDWEGHIDMVFLFCEVEPPYAMYACRPSGAMKTAGLQRWQRAVRGWRECLANNVWPGYGGRDIGVLDLPQWAVSEMIYGPEYIATDEELDAIAKGVNQS